LYPGTFPKRPALVPFWTPPKTFCSMFYKASDRSEIISFNRVEIKDCKCSDDMPADK